MMSNSPEQTIFYVYAILDPRSILRPFYIGKGSGNRAFDHTKPSSSRIGGNILKNRVIAKIREVGLEPVIHYWQEKMTENEAFDLEKSLIQRFGRRDNGSGILTNMTNGGEGMSGYVYSDERRQAMRDRMLGPTNPTRGKGHSPESRQKMSKSQKFRSAQGYRTYHSDAHRDNLKKNNPGGIATRKVVLKIDLRGNVVAEYPSRREAIRQSGCASATFSKQCRPGGLPLNEFFWRFAGANEMEKDYHSVAQTLIERRERHSRNSLAGKSIGRYSLDGSLLETFDSLAEAHRAFPAKKYATLWSAIKHERPYAGWIWKYMAD